MFLARLVDEFPPPKQDDEMRELAGISVRDADSNLRKTEEIRYDSCQHTDFKGHGICTDPS